MSDKNTDTVVVKVPSERIIREKDADGNVKSVSISVPPAAAGFVANAN